MLKVTSWDFELWKRKELLADLVNLTSPAKVDLIRSTAGLLA